MDRVRRAAVIAPFLVYALASVAFAGRVVDVGGVRPAAVVSSLPVSWPTVSWPASTLVLSEVMTGGASASDEFVELANAGPAPVDLVGLEVAYVTASGSTVTRKGSWSASLLLEPGRHVLIANAAGIHAASADATYAGGLAATGGALVLRPIGGAPIDAVGWGDATNGFVEGAAVAAPPAGSSAERQPGGLSGNGSDTNDNATDWFVQPAPSPQNLASGPTPTPAPSVSPSPTPGTSPTPTPTPIETPSPEPTSAPTSTPSPVPTASPSPTATPSPSPTPLPTPSPMPIVEARALPDDSTATVAGTLTTSLGALESGHTAFLQDSSGGIAIYLDVAAVDPWPAGTTVVATGTLDDRFALRTLRVTTENLVATGSAALPLPVSVATGFAAEDAEGLRVVVAGTTVGSPSAMADGTGLLVDDGTGPLRLIVSAVALGGASVPSGTAVTATGPLGQRDSSGTGLAGYRLHATEPGDFALAAPTPTPSPEPTVSPSPTVPPSTAPSPTPTSSPSADPTPTPSATSTPPPSPEPVSVAAARSSPIGSTVTVRGVVTAEAGRLGTPALFPIGDATGGIVVRLPAGASAPGRGVAIEVRGTLAAPYGQLELRPKADGIVVRGTAAQPRPLEIDGADLGEAVEGRLVALDATIDAKPKRAKSGDLTISATAADGTALRILADGSSGIAQTAFVKGDTYALVGVAGQRATKKGALDGYRVWLRDRADIERIAAGETPAPTSSPGASPSPSRAAAVPVAQALLVRSGPVTVEATVTADASLLDASGRRIVVEDGTAAVEVLLPAGTLPPGIGTTISVSGTMGRAYGAPRLKATDVGSIAGGVPRRPLDVRGAPGPAHEWRLVRLSGTIEEVHKLGGRWRMELAVAGARVPVTGLDGANIPVTRLVVGRVATVVGIVRRAHPSASDRRFGVLPRSTADISVGPAGAAEPSRNARDGGRDARSGRPVNLPAGPRDVDLAALAGHLGETVRVGGLIVDLARDGVSIDDGTAVGWVLLENEAGEYLPLLEAGDPINATGRVERRGDRVAVVVEDPAGLARVGDLAELPSAPPAAQPAPTASVPDRPTTASSDPFGLGLPGSAGLASLVAISLASAGVTLIRRRQLQRRLLARVAARLEAIRRPAARSSGSDGAIPEDAGRGP